MFESAPHTPPSPRVETRLKPHDARDNRVQAGGNATGVTIVHRMTNEAEYEHESNFILGLTPIDTPGKAILTALIGSLGGGGTVSTMMNLVTGKVGTLRLVVGPRS